MREEFTVMLIIAVGVIACVAWLIDQWMQWAARRVYRANERFRAMAPRRRTTIIRPKKNLSKIDQMIVDLHRHWSEERGKG